MFSMLSDKSQAQREMYCIISLTYLWNLKKAKLVRVEQNHECQSDRAVQEERDAGDMVQSFSYTGGTAVVIYFNNLIIKHCIFQNC